VNEGKVLALSVAQAQREQEKHLALHRDLLGRVHEVMQDPHSDIELIPRLAATHAQGILFTEQERDASIILMGWRGKRTLRESLLGSVLDEVIWGSDTPVMVGKLTLPLNGTQRVVFILPPKAVPLIALRRMLEANLSLAKALNVPLVIHADTSYQRSLDDLLPAIDTDHPVSVGTLKAPFKPALLDEESISSFIVVPGFGSRKRVADTLGNLPEQLAAAFDGGHMKPEVEVVYDTRGNAYAEDTGLRPAAVNSTQRFEYVDLYVSLGDPVGQRQLAPYLLKSEVWTIDKFENLSDTLRHYRFRRLVGTDGKSLPEVDPLAPRP